MREKAKESKPETSTSLAVHKSERDLRQKNKLLAESEKPQDQAKQPDEGNRS